MLLHALWRHNTVLEALTCQKYNKCTCWYYKGELPPIVIDKYLIKHFSLEIHLHLLYEKFLIYSKHCIFVESSTNFQAEERTKKE